MIPYNKPFYHKDCLKYIKNTNNKGIQSGDGYYSKKCIEFFQTKYDFNHCLLVPSCTHALEMMAMLIDISNNDEIIIPSYTFVSTANAFRKFGAKIICVDSESTNPNISINEIEKNITKNTKAVCVVHYGGWACDIENIKKLCDKHNIILLEDAAQAINSYYKNIPLGSFGAMSGFSFHETKNINCGEGGLLVINDDKYIKRAEIIREKGTNRTSFFKGEVEKYEWVDIGSSYLLSDIQSAYLFKQLENIDSIILHRQKVWECYHNNLVSFEKYKYFKLCYKHENCNGNYHIFYFKFNSEYELKNIKNILKDNNILATTHYVPLHKSDYYLNYFNNIELPNSENFGKLILRLPLYNNLTIKDCNKISNIIINNIKPIFYKIKHTKISENQINDIINLKMQFWNFDLNSQKRWIINNIKDNDIHILLKINKKLIGYGMILKRDINIIDSIIIHEDFRNHNYGGELIQYINSIFKTNGFLLCEKHNINFYNKFNWIENNNLKVINKTIDSELYKMIYNFDKSIDSVIY